jgi:hypothetical protein
MASQEAGPSSAEFRVALFMVTMGFITSYERGRNAAESMNN